MKKYDDASWHYEGEFPKNLSSANASTHIGIFLAWCINNDLVCEELVALAGEKIQQLKERKITGNDILITICDEKLMESDLNELGNEFARDYYEDETDFANHYGSYLDDYALVFEEKADESGFEYESLYHVENTVENYDLIKIVLNKRFEEWKQFHADKFRL